MRTLLCAAALVAVVGGAAPAGAESPERQAEARILFEEGNRLFDAKDYAGAVEKYRAAYDRYANPKLLLNLGTALQLVGRNAQAMEAYERYLADPAAEGRRKQQVRKLLGELEKRVARLAITTDPPDAIVTLDGQPSAAGLRRVEPGEHTASAAMDGYVSRKETVALSAGEERSVDLRLERAPPPAVVEAAPTQDPAAPGRIPPPAMAVADPPEPREAAFLPAGGSSGRSYRPPAWSPWAALGVAVVAGGAGAYFGYQTTDPGVLVEGARSAQTRANVSFVAAGLAAVGAGALWTWRISTDD